MICQECKSVSPKLLFGPCLYGDAICFANVAFLESIPSTPLNASIQHFNTRRISVVNRTLQGNFLGIGPPKNLGCKTTGTYFRRLRNSMATVRANISGEDHDTDNQEMALEATKGHLHRPKFDKLWSTNG